MGRATKQPSVLFGAKQNNRLLVRGQGGRSRGVLGNHKFRVKNRLQSSRVDQAEDCLAWSGLCRLGHVRPGQAGLEPRLGRRGQSQGIGAR